MNIDWSKAPEGATHYDCRPHATPAFMQKNPDDPKRWNYWNRDGELIYYGFMPDDQAAQMIQRPPAWTGEGLPPVGTVCEWLHHRAPPKGNSEWRVGDVRYISDCTVIIGGEGCEHVHHPRNCSFRSIRTAEQIAAEERRVEERRVEIIHIQAASVVNCGPYITETAAAAIYDAGYRKQVQP